MDRMTQLRRALALLRERGSVTAGELMDYAGMGSPRKRISELKRSPMLQGYEIVDQWEEGHNRYGEPVRYKRYFLKKTGERITTPSCATVRNDKGGIKQ